VQPSSLKMPVATSPKILDSGTPGLTYYPSIDQRIGLVGQVGSVIGDDPKAILSADSKESASDTLKKLEAAYNFGKGELDLNRKFARSSTGELEVDGTEGYLKIATPRTDAIVTVKDAKLSSGLLSADNKKGFASISASSLDGKDLAVSKRLLVLHLTNSFNTMTKFRDKSLTILENYGKLPHLAHRGIADLTLKLAPGSEPKVYAIDLGGKRLGEVKSAFSSVGELAFTVDTFTFKTPCFAYEIVR